MRVVDPRWVTPVPAGLAGLAGEATVLVTVEDGVLVNGAGSRFAQFLGERGIFVHTREIGIPVEFLEHGSVREVRAAIGLNPQGISRRVIEFAAAVLGRGELGRSELARQPVRETIPPLHHRQRRCLDGGAGGVGEYRRTVILTLVVHHDISRRENVLPTHRRI